MSEIDKEDYKREYLPLVNNKSETQSEGNDVRRINLSDNIGGASNKPSNMMQTDEDPGFFKRNKKPLLIAGGIILGIGVILAIVLPIVLKPGPGPTPPGPTPPGPVPPVPPVPPGPDPNPV